MATRLLFDEFVDAQTEAIDIDITIDQGTVSLAYKSTELRHDVHVAAFRWKSGETLVSSAIDIQKPILNFP